MWFCFQQPFVGGALRDATKNGCVGDYILVREPKKPTISIEVFEVGTVLVYPCTCTGTEAKQTIDDTGTALEKQRIYDVKSLVYRRSEPRLVQKCMY